jgi:sporulation protein YlmC with PRC-barrel domain
MYKSNMWLAGNILKDRVRNAAGENLGKIEDIVIDPASGNVRYAVLSFGGLLGMGNKLFAVPWSALRPAPARDYLLLNVDRETLERAPGFDRDHWPDMEDSVWQDRINSYYGAPDVPVSAYDRPVAETRPLHERTVDSERRHAARARRGIGLGTGLMLAILLLGVGWFVYLVSTRGWEQTQRDLSGSVQGAAYAMKESSADATLTAKVRTAFSLSKRIPADKINVDSENDVVTLRGEVATDEIRNLAESTARDVPGVKQVRNHLFVLQPVP